MGIGHIQAENTDARSANGADEHGAPGVTASITVGVDKNIGYHRRDIHGNPDVTAGDTIFQMRQQTGGNKGPDLLARAVVGTLGSAVILAVGRTIGCLGLPGKVAAVFPDSGSFRIVAIAVAARVEGMQEARRPIQQTTCCHDLFEPP